MSAKDSIYRSTAKKDTIGRTEKQLSALGFEF
jgi:hypothetical protein